MAIGHIGSFIGTQRLVVIQKANVFLCPCGGISVLQWPFSVILFSLSQRTKWNISCTSAYGSLPAPVKGQCKLHSFHM